MPNTQILQTIIWAFALLGGVIAILAMFKLRYAERFLPQWNELNTFESSLQVRREEWQKLMEDLQRKQAEIGQLEATIGHLRILKEWQAANPDAPARIQQMMVDLEKYKAELAAIQQKLAQDEQRLADVTRETNSIIAEKEVLTHERDAVRDHLTELNKQKARLEKNVGDLDDQQRQHESKITTLKEVLQGLDNDLVTIKQEIETASREKREAIAERDQVSIARDAARADLELTSKRLDAANSELSQLTHCRDSLLKEKNQLESEIAGLTKKRDNTSEEVKSAQELLARVTTKLEEMEAACLKAKKERDEAFAARDVARVELASLEKVLETTKANLERLNAQLSSSGLGDVDVAKSLEDLAQPALKFDFKRSATWDEATALRRLADYLKAKGLHYPERVQLAFHTSLKAAHINPLVVLAGVSGTGKSALPMAYAEALGINFLSLAVQPGWSGPQDLLGFYNYLERKYKATELARALAQMSRFSDSDLPDLPIKGRKDQMLLLLLDEMNLARIEYYFSDFLSRLEQRRGRNFDDHQRRREISLLIDAGSLPKNESPRYIFPDLNVLFVGTMNEDESTQSLSDKVIDRANVLRFGAPKELKASNGAHAAPSTDYLPRSKWESWTTSFDGNSLDTVRKTLVEINDQLETINRPFGHRVYRAILDYVANYPSAQTDESRRANALADQIEQKIIPKLRGLDTQDDTAARCLDQLGKVIGDLRDAELATAYDKARSQHLFEWFGVKRS